MEQGVKKEADVVEPPVINLTPPNSLEAFHLTENDVGVDYVVRVRDKEYRLNVQAD